MRLSRAAMCSKNCIHGVSTNSALARAPGRVLLTTALGVDLGADPQLCEMIMETVDKDRSGNIDFIEFLSYVRISCVSVCGRGLPSFHDIYSQKSSEF